MTEAPLQVVEACKLPLETGPCTGRIRRYYFSQKSKDCHEFFYSGCDGNANNFENPEICQSICFAKNIRPLKRDDARREYICSQPRAAGRCASLLRRFHFNLNTKNCEEFVYGGCEGNDNNWITGEDCVNFCGAIGLTRLVGADAFKHPSDAKQICSEPVEKGNCLQLKPRFHFNNKTSRCEEFIYSGCGGNRNNFIHGDECATLCRAGGISYLEKQPPGPPLSLLTPYQFFPTDPACLQPPQRGPCRGNFEAFFFNPAIRSCQQFLYSGCGGSGNSFPSAQECVVRCRAIDVLFIKN